MKLLTICEIDHVNGIGQCVCLTLNGGVRTMEGLALAQECSAWCCAENTGLSWAVLNEQHTLIAQGDCATNRIRNLLMSAGIGAVGEALYNRS